MVVSFRPNPTRRVRVRAFAILQSRHPWVGAGVRRRRRRRLGSIFGNNLWLADALSLYVRQYVGPPSLLPSFLFLFCPPKREKIKRRTNLSTFDSMTVASSSFHICTGLNIIFKYRFSPSLPTSLTCHQNWINQEPSRKESKERFTHSLTPKVHQSGAG